MGLQQTGTMREPEARRLVNRYLAAVRQRLPVVERTLREHGRLPLEDYLERVIARAPASYQPRDELGEAVCRCASPLLGEAVARQVCAELASCPVVLTANHHGVDYFAQSLQSTLLFSLRQPGRGKQANTVPVLACGNVPLDNVTYPRGALLYDNGCRRELALPQRLPLFPDRLKRNMVAQVAAFDEPMLRRMQARVARWLGENRLEPAIAKALDTILTHDYRSPEVLGHCRYSDQAVLLNRRIWRRLLAAAGPRPELAYLELERVSGILLQADLEDGNSLAYTLIFDAGLRSQLLHALDGVPGCWLQEELIRRRELGGQLRQRPVQRCGTVLFWGIDEGGHKIPLMLDERGAGGTRLCGVSDAGKAWQIALAPGALVQGIRDGRLLPSVFSCLLVLAFARGVTCAGGYYQANYLQAMQRVLVALLGQRPDREQAAALLASVPTASYLSGMQAVMRHTAQGGLIPAGPVEIIAGGGLSDDHLQQIRSLTVKEAHIASLLETLTDAAPELVRGMPHWKRQLSCACHLLLKDKVAII